MFFVRALKISLQQQEAKQERESGNNIMHLVVSLTYSIQNRILQLQLLKTVNSIDKN